MACIAAGLVGGERFAVDASLIEADANKRRAVKRADWDADAIDPEEPRSVVNQDDFIRYRASSLDCGACPLKPRCCPNTPERKVSRSIHEGARDMAREITASRTSRCPRRCARRSRCSSHTSNASSA